MDDAARQLNATLEREAPAAFRCLSPLGRQVAFPRGIPWQSGAARGTEINATIGQVTDGRGGALPLPVMREAVAELDERMAFLYSPQDGHPALRQAWARRQRELSGGSSAPLSAPFVTHGLTQGLSLCADLFIDAETTVVLPDPTWENYDLVLGLRTDPRFERWAFYRDGGLNVEGLAEALGRVRGKAVVVLNFPSNPSGYTPTRAELAQVVEVLLAHEGPAVVLVDDAYQGMLYEDGLIARSPYWDLAERADPDRLFPVKIDGATKELLFFGGRVGFVSHAAEGPAEAGLLSKLKCLGRGTVSVPPGPSQALVLKALQSPDLQQAIDERLELLAGRYRALKQALVELQGTPLTPLPFNSGCFALLDVHPSVDADALRERLIEEQRVGLIYIPGTNALRIAFCSTTAEALPELVSRLKRAVG